MLYARTGIIDTHFSLILTYVALNVPFTIWLSTDSSARCRKISRKPRRIDAAPLGRPSGRWSFRLPARALRRRHLRFLTS